MFEDNQNKPNLDADLPLGDAPAAPGKPSSGETPTIHTMPDRFFIGDEPPKGGKKRSPLVLIIIVLLVLVALGVGAAVLLKNGFAPNANQNANTNTVTNANTANRNASGLTNVLANLSNGTTIFNVNASTNQNANSNANGNVNATTNANVNANANTNTSVVVTGSLDTDADGLTDIEEGEFTTDVTKSDTDGDTFLDGQEVKAGFNPKGSGAIDISSLVKSSANPTFQFSVLYPASWVVKARGTDGRDTIMTAPASDEFVEVTVQDNPGNLTAKQWYQAQSPGVDVTTLSTITTTDRALEGIRSPDGLNAYFAKGAYVYVFSYNVGIKTTADHLASFEMIAESFRLTTLSPALPVNTNASSNGNANTSNSNASGTSTNATPGGAGSGSAGNGNTNASGGPGY